MYDRSTMGSEHWTEERQLLAGNVDSIGPGLSEAELVAAESVLDFQFPEDLRSLLSEMLPIGGSFPNWREPDSDNLREWLGSPFGGIAFDIERNEFWSDAWGKKPAKIADAIAAARTAVNAAPRLIPIYGDRYMAAVPALTGAPVFSLHQTDIIYYGSNLRAYLRCEFGDLDWSDAVAKEMKFIPFWTDFIEGDC